MNGVRASRQRFLFHLGLLLLQMRTLQQDGSTVNPDPCYIFIRWNVVATCHPPFFPCKSLHFRCERMVKGFFNVCTFTVYASCEQQSTTPTLPAGFNQTCKLLEGSQAESIPRNRLTLLVTMWTLMAHSCLQWLPGCLRLAASCNWFNSGPVPSSVDPVHHLDTKNNTDRTNLSC